MPSKKICRFNNCKRTRNNGDLCKTHHDRAKNSADGQPYDVERECLICQAKMDVLRWFCISCIESHSKEERRKIYKKLHYTQNIEKYRESKKRNPVESSRAKSYNIKYHYGLTDDEYSAMVVAHEGKCAICGVSPEDYEGRNKWLVLDHDHSTGLARGLLCHRCNMGLGYFKDNPEYLKSAIKYLKEGRVCN